MKPIKVTRPKFPKGYADKPVSFLTWDWVVERLTESKHYWLCSVRPHTPEAPAGRPHVVPRWCVYVDGKIYYDGSLETRHAVNIRTNPHVTVNLESGQEAIILEGTTRMAGKPSPELGKKLAQAYKKYKEYGYTPGPHSWDKGGLFVFTPRQCMAWTTFNENPTKFIFEEEESS